MNQLVKPNGTRIDLPGSGEYSVDELQDLVDGYIAVEKVKDGFLVYDDDGAFKCKVFNIEATKMVLDYKRSVDSKTADEWTGFVSGDAVLCEKVKVE